MSESNAILAVFAKQPMRGHTKTRLAQATTPEWAERIAEAFLGDTLDRCSELNVQRTIVYAPAPADEFFVSLANGRYDAIPQIDGDLGRRLRAFFDQARTQGSTRIVAIGTDSPMLPIDMVLQSFHLLASYDVVLGPAFDGGYYLVGMSRDCLTIFDDIPWSTSRVLETTVLRVQRASASLALLPPWYDVDTVDDWNMLCGHVLALRQAGIDPRTPRVEQLIHEQMQESACRKD